MSFKAVPSLIIGLGGTGLKAVTLIKKSIMEANQNQVPSNLSFLVIDTEDEIKFKAGGWGEAHYGTRATGPVQVDYAGEYVPLTGNVSSLARELMREQIEAETNPSSRRDQPHHHMTQWFQSKFYLTDYRVDDQVWASKSGAGRLRQFGRLGLFSRQKLVIDRLRDSLQAIRNTGANQVFVHVIGSIVGGTGSSLYADVAHLIGRLASRVGFMQLPAVFGHFVLTEAFRGTAQVQLSQPGMRADFDARAYAALRELIRLQGITPDAPYPMTYDPRGTGELSAKLEKSPYNNLFLYDGQRRANPLSDKLIEDGIAPTIADAVLAFVDSQSAGAFVSHSVNLKSFYAGFDVPQAQVTFGSIGTYTIELPIFHITESWSHALARQALDVLLDPAERDSSNGVPVTLAANRSGGEACDANEDLTQWLDATATRLIAEFVNWGRKARASEMMCRQTAKDVLRLDGAHWQALLAPTHPEWQDLVIIAKTELEASLVDRTDKRYFVMADSSGNTNEKRAANLRVRVEQSLQRMVGRTTDVWQREGGEYRKTLGRLASSHDQIYRKSLAEWLTATLNGAREASTSMSRKAGKLGYAIGYIELLLEVLRDARRVLEVAAAVRDTECRRQWDALSSDMGALHAEINRRGGGLLKARYRDYVSKANEMAQFYKVDIARAVASDLLGNVQKVTEQAHRDLLTWRRALAAGSAADGGAYALVAQGLERIATDRRNASSAVRWVIADDERGDRYLAEERDKYLAGGEALNRILDSMVWQVGPADPKGDLNIDFGMCGLATPASAPDQAHLWNRLAGEKGRLREGEASLMLLLNCCRSVFEDSLTSMSVADYLASNYALGRTKELARLVNDRLGIPLSTNRHDDAPMKTTYMRVQRGTTHATALFLTSLLLELRGLTGLRNIYQNELHDKADRAEIDMNYMDLSRNTGCDSHDPTKISFVLFGDLLQPDEVTGCKEAQAAYHRVSAASEMWRTLHIFAAETNSLEIELGLSTCEPRFVQRRRELANDVTRILEDMDAFELAMLCLAYAEGDYNWGKDSTRGLLLHRYVSRERENVNGNGYWRLQPMPSGRYGSDWRLRSFGRILAQPIEYQLSDIGRTPDLLQAFTQFTVHRKDKRSGTEIDFAQIEDTLRWAMSEHSKKWAERGHDYWRLKTHSIEDERLRNEASEKAGRIIRLNALVATAAVELAKHEWAWKRDRTGKAPLSLGFDEANEVQAYVDLWSVLRFVALREMQNLQDRFLELADWLTEIPEDIILSSNSSTVEPPPIDSNSDDSQESGDRCGNVDGGSDFEEPRI